jgi:hypothetical protein
MVNIPSEVYWLGVGIYRILSLQKEYSCHSFASKVLTIVIHIAYDKVCLQYDNMRWYSSWYDNWNYCLPDEDIVVIYA